MPKNETEKALQDSLRDMELQCKERVDLLEALKKSRKEAKGDKKSSDTSSKSTITKAAAHRSDASNWLGEGTIPPVNYPDLSRPEPPPLPLRPTFPPRQISALQSSSSHGPSPIQMGSGSYGSAQTTPTLSNTLPSTPSLPVPPTKVSRTPSPDKKGGRVMLTTLRGPKDARKASKTPKVPSGRFNAPPASSKAAGLAWDQTSKAQNGSSSTLDSGRRESMGGNNSSRPESTHMTDSDDVGIYGGSLLHPSARVEDRRPSVQEESRRGSRQTNVNGGPPVPKLIDIDPPTPPGHETTPASKPVLSRWKHESPVRSKPPIDYPSYRTEFPPTSASAKDTVEFLSRKRPDETITPQVASTRGRSPPATKAPAPGLTRRPVANSSTPRTSRFSKDDKLTLDTQGSNDENASSGPELAHGGRKKKAAQKASTKEPVPADGPTPKEKSDNDSPTSPPGTDAPWKDRLKYVKKNLPKGVDEQAAKQIFNDIVVQGDEVHWADVAGLEPAKKALKEAVVYPFLRPDLFMGLREPARGMLLFGPPGTGKTMLARAVATESRSTFFAISASSLTSKWLGESEKLVRALFSLAKALAPSIIFVDEIDSLLSSRGGSSEHETTRRIKTEFLIQWSDLQRAAAGKQQSEKEKQLGDASRVLVLAATNLPWAIDEAARRRFVRRQYIPLPENHVRAEQLRTLLGHQKHSLNKKDIAVLVELTDGMLASRILGQMPSGETNYICRLLRQ